VNTHALLLNISIGTVPAPSLATAHIPSELKEASISVIIHAAQQSISAMMVSASQIVNSHWKKELKPAGITAIIDVITPTNTSTGMEPVQQNATPH